MAEDKMNFRGRNLLLGRGWGAPNSIIDWSFMQKGTLAHLVLHKTGI